MTHATIFAVACLVGTLVGMPSGHYLPLWLSGAPAWVMAAAALLIRPLRPSQQDWRWAFAAVQPDLVRGRIRQLDEAHSRRVACLALGLFWGAMAGAAATSMSTVLDWLLWPGHDDDGWGVAVATLAAMGWLVGAAVDVEDEPLRPGRAGLFLYLVVVTLCALPALLEEVL